MTLVVFVGPTLPVEDAAAVVAADYRPPAGHGDVFRAARERPRAIGIIDGVFHAQASVWHKEVLWALAQGIAVFGAASLGALRAAELAPFGMRGIGTIFEAFRDGVLEDDDEVAVAHGDEASGYRLLCQPMVNIRATLAAAERAGVVSGAARATIEDQAKRTFYPERRLDRIVAAAGPEGELEWLQRWLLAGGGVDQKREDAVAMLRAMRDWLACDPPPDRPRFTFAETLEWRRFVGRARGTAQASS